MASGSGGARNPVRLAVRPVSVPTWMHEAVLAGGAEVVEPAHATGLVWGHPHDIDGLTALLETSPHLEWVQLPWAGVERFVHLVDRNRRWTCAKGVYAEPVAELALSLGLAGLRGVGHYARATTWTGPQGRNLQGARVTILGGGGITTSLVRLLQPFNTHITVVRQHVQAMDGVDDVVESDRFADALPGADLVVLALALTPDTIGIIGADELAMMEPHTWLVNVARGRHIVTDDLVEALANQVLGGAALDVTDPEPLPDEHALWREPRCLITPHVGNTPEMAVPLLSERITANVRRYGAGDALIGVIDPELGY
jgi:phosphoglycerate dehydrogenase-like enzyme